MYFVYILLCNNYTLYIGYTGDIKRRVEQHKRKEVKYTSSFFDVRLVYFERLDNKELAIRREKQLKGWSRQKKINLIKFGHP